MTTVLVTGGNGQLARSIKANEIENVQFIYYDASELDIYQISQVQSVFKKNKIDYCINCAAYTAVDAAESNQELAFNVNTLGAKNLAIACLEYNVVLIHISTDFVFDGGNIKPYTELDIPNPLSFYGKTKLEGEQFIQSIFDNYFIIRTSWLYSEFGNNFMKTMLRLGKEKKSLSIVNDQIGTPTYAVDLAKVILKIIVTKNSKFGTYHYSNNGETSWFGFAEEIFNQCNNNIELKAIKSEDYPTAAIRPKYSVLNKTKIQQAIEIKIPFWKDSLKVALANSNTQ
ncbi:dTDP-4-dehydrorhamnose reductase [Urechidicola croceus]|uniref:dTDP-4-dehydrorhamnose reductase n=1 Tax=Urechidicola croceus TaxID=1850246 RepID=A0A1D8P9A6_9FLAO|nr:dTDP-4-dehydrorhamnose reductase [Urechidicola croceus]AOW21152.1 dTDP-4-dehydrorhamnose reductase [Urechidicola croceus]